MIMPLIKLGNWNEINRAETLTESVYKNEKKQKKTRLVKCLKGCTQWQSEMYIIVLALLCEINRKVTGAKRKICW